MLDTCHRTWHSAVDTSNQGGFIMSGVFGQGSGGRSTRKGSSLRRRSTAVLVGSLIALTAAAGCSSSKAGGSGTGSAGAAVGDTLTFGTAATPPTLNPA